MRNPAHSCLVLLGLSLVPVMAQPGGSAIQPSGKWCVTTRANANDGFWNQCILVVTTRTKGAAPDTHGLLSIEGVCVRCKGKDAAPYISREPAILKAIPNGLAIESPGLPPLFPAKTEFLFQNKAGASTITGPDLYGEPSTYERDADFGDFRPSFNCTKAQQPRDRAICASPRLSLLDQQLSLTFRAVQRCAFEARNGSLERITASQNAWWSTKLSACKRGDCVEPLYRERMAELPRLCTVK